MGQNGAHGRFFSISFFSCFWVRFWTIFGSILAPKRRMKKIPGVVLGASFFAPAPRGPPEAPQTPFLPFFDKFWSSQQTVRAPPDIFLFSGEGGRSPEGGAVFGGSPPRLKHLCKNRKYRCRKSRFQIFLAPSTVISIAWCKRFSDRNQDLFPTK